MRRFWEGAKLKIPKARAIVQGHGLGIWQPPSLDSQFVKATHGHPLSGQTPMLGLAKPHLLSSPFRSTSMIETSLGLGYSPLSSAVAMGRLNTAALLIQSQRAGEHREGLAWGRHFRLTE